MKRKVRIIHESYPQVGPAEVQRRLLTLDVDSETTVGEIVAWADGIYRRKRGGYNLTVVVNLRNPTKEGRIMPVERALPTDDPIMQAWQAWKRTDQYANAKKWLAEGSPTDNDGELWAAFLAGWQASPPQQAAEPVEGELHHTINKLVRALENLMESCDMGRTFGLDVALLNEALVEGKKASRLRARVQPRRVSREEAALIENYLIDTYGDTRAEAKEGVREILEALDGLQIEGDDDEQDPR